MSERQPSAPSGVPAFLRGRPGAAALLALAAAALLLGPLRDIPVDDDWMYRWTVDGLLAHGRLVIHDLASPSLVLHALWGWLFSLPAGPSYGALRVSTLVLAALPLWLTAEGSSRRGPLNPGLWLLFNPLFLLLSFTYMTDVPYLAWAVTAVWLYALAMDKDSAPLLLAASVAAGAAFLVRQPGLVIPACAAVMLAAGGRRKTLLLPALLPALLAAAGYYLWFYGSHGPNWAHYYYSYKIAPRLLDAGPYALETLRRLAASVLYLSLFTAPYALRILAGEGLKVLKGRKAALGLAAGLVFFIAWGALPYFTGGGVISAAGIGRAYLGDALPGLLKPHGPWGGPVFMGLLTALAALSLAVWCARWRDLLAGARENSFNSLLVLAGLAQVLAMLLFFDAFFDRYLLPLVPGALLAASAAADRAAQAGKARLLPAAVISVGLAAWSFTGVWDHLNFSEAKWRAGRAAVAAGFAPELIANGYEWDAVHSYERNVAKLKEGKKEIGPWDWRVVSDIEARSSFRAPVSAELALSSASYFSPLTLRRETVYVNRERR
jgi:4-amino-4-deoxy-L-arabinose transferase-like glycosyltransferase